MTTITDTLDLVAMRLTSGEGRRLDLLVQLPSFELGGQTYDVTPAQVPVKLDLSRTTGQGYALRLRFQVTLAGPCMRCLDPASTDFSVDAREISQPGAADDELESPYVDGDGILEVAAWANDALALMLPAAILCRPDCAGLCPDCGMSLNDAGADHHHESEPDLRWAKLSELKFDS